MCVIFQCDVDRCSDSFAKAADSLSKGRVREAKSLLPEEAGMISMAGPLLRGVVRPRPDGVKWGKEILRDLERVSRCKVVVPF